jgi:hypothetical protein
MTMNLLRGAATGASALTSVGLDDGVRGAGAPRLFAGGAGNSLGGLSPALAAHGMLGLIAFALLMPLGMVLSRHKWLFGPDKHNNTSVAAGAAGASAGAAPRSGAVGRGWFVAHASVQVLAVLTALATLLTVLLGVGWDKTPPSAAYDAHRAFGIIAVIIALAQATLGAVFRPRDVSASLGAGAAKAASGGGKEGFLSGADYSDHGDHVRAVKRRTAWLHGHRSGAWLALLTGWTAVFLGCGQMVSVRGAEPAWWFGPAAALVLAFVLLGLVLEAFKRQMQLTGRYDPRSREVRRDLALMSPVGGSRAGTTGGGAGVSGGGAAVRGASAGGAVAGGGAVLANGAASAGGASSGGGFRSAGGASAAPSAAGTAYYSAVGGSSAGGASAGAASAGGAAAATAVAVPAGGGGDVYPDIVAGADDGRGFLPPPPAV